MMIIGRVIAKVQQLLVCGERKPKSGIVHAGSGVYITKGKAGGGGQLTGPCRQVSGGDSGGGSWYRVSPLVI